MIFTFNGVELSIEDKLAKKLNILHKREVTINNFTLLIIGGVMGTGKSNIASLACAYKASLSKQEYNVDHVFFDADKMIDFAVKNDNQIIHFDEALFASLASDWQTKVQKKLLKMLMLCRKKRHFFVFCIPDFFKLKDFLAVESSHGLIHCYLRDGVTPGRFLYFAQKRKNMLYYEWKKSGTKNSKKYHSFRGSFPIALKYVLDEQAYERKKDYAISTLLDDNKPEFNKDKDDLHKIKGKIAFLPETLGIQQKTFAKAFGVSPRVMQRWKNDVKKDISLREKALSSENEDGDYGYYQGDGKRND